MAKRARLAISTTRVVILSSLRRDVANSALARSRSFGMASRTASNQPVCGGVQNEADLVGRASSGTTCDQAIETRAERTLI
jgi:hypothetical protein